MQVFDRMHANFISLLYLDSVYYPERSVNYIWGGWLALLWGHNTASYSLYMGWHQRDRLMIPMLCDQRILKFYSTLSIILCDNLVSRRYWSRWAIVWCINITLAFYYAIRNSSELSLCLWILPVGIHKNLLNSRKLDIFGLIHQLKDTFRQNYHVTALVFVSQF